ncbi:MAG TPA: hypothetical protein VFD66_07010 [Verrucomicrobiae bacterium]|nr:hypothetical protein [Verrucomicrobiae bacterium]
MPISASVEPPSRPEGVFPGLPPSFFGITFRNSPIWRFARLAVKEPVLVSATVEKSQAFAVKLDRAEAELLVLPERVHVEGIEAIDS